MYDVRWTSNGIEWKHRGDVSLHEIMSANAEFMGDARSDAAKYQLIDLREVDEFDLSESDMEIIGSMDLAQSESTPHLRVAFIVADDGLDAKLDAYASALEGSSWRVRIFTDEADARRWVAEPKLVT